MITAQQAYENYVKWQNYSQIEKFVRSVLKKVITDEHIAAKSVYETESNFFLCTIFKEIFLTEEVDGVPVYANWAVDFTKLPDELYGKRDFEIISELERMYEINPENSFICRAFKALILELEIVWEFKVHLDVEQQILTVSWNLSSTENT